jgi:3-oxoacyl-[acyl-carrier-protein] synthase II
MRRVVVTGTGLINGCGRDVHDLLSKIQSGGVPFVSFSEASRYMSFLNEGLHPTLAPAIVSPVAMTEEELATVAEVDKPKRFDRHQLFALIAAKEAMRGVKIDDPLRFACIGATGGAGLITIFESCKRLIEGMKLSPFDNLKYLPNIFVGTLTKRYGIKGPSIVHGTACAASMHAVSDLCRRIMMREVDAGLVVGAEAAISPFGIASFQSQRALGNGLAFQEGRTGFVMGEGAGAVVLESYEHAKKHGRDILAEIVGYADSSDGVEDGLITDPSPEGAYKTAQAALLSASLSPRCIDLVKLHGTATPAGDKSETYALSLLAREKAKELPVVSLKSYFGHLLGAAGVVELVTTISMMRRDSIFPTRGLTRENLDPKCDLLDHVMEERTGRGYKTALLNGFGFGGTNSSIVLQLIDV